MLFAIPSICVTFIASCWHTASHPPQPVQHPVSTTSTPFSKRIAFSVQLRQQAPQSMHFPVSKTISDSLNSGNTLRSSRWPGTTVHPLTSSRGTCISVRRAILTSPFGTGLNVQDLSPRRRSTKLSRASANIHSGCCSASILIKRTWYCTCHRSSSFTPGAGSVKGPTRVSSRRKRFRGAIPVMAAVGQTNRQLPHSIQRLSSTETPVSVKAKTCAGQASAQARQAARRKRRRTHACVTSIAGANVNPPISQY